MRQLPALIAWVLESLYAQNATEQVMSIVTLVEVMDTIHAIYAKAKELLIYLESCRTVQGVEAMGRKGVVCAMEAVVKDVLKQNTAERVLVREQKA